LHEAGFALRIASRHPDRARSLFPRDDSAIEPVRADVNDESSVTAAVVGAFAVVNAVSLYVEQGKNTYHSVHVEAAKQVAEHARRAGAERFVHISGIGADAKAAASPYIRSRGEGEAAVIQAFFGATVVRPAVMFGPDDAFVVPLLTMLRRLPVFPLFGAGETRLQPVYVEDVAEAIVRILRASSIAQVYELAGPRIYTYAELLRTISAGVSRQPLMIPVPFALWRALGYTAQSLPRPPITVNQVDLMERDNIAAPDIAGFSALQLEPKPIENILPEILHDIG
jgi:NADH dehydrogenase